MFAWYDGKLSAADYYVGRVNLLENSYGYGRASVNLTSIRETDAGWYECRVIFPNRTPNTRNNGTWFHLAIESGSLIKIPPINQTVMESELAYFHCGFQFLYRMYLLAYFLKKFHFQTKNSISKV